MNIAFGPKVQPLTTKETVSSLEAWKANVLYGLRLNPNFKEYLEDGFVFGRKSRNSPCRDMLDIFRKETITDEENKRKEVMIKEKSKEDRCAEVDLLLEQVANYCPHVPRADIVKDCSSMKEVWRTVREFYNKQQTGASLNDVWNIRRDLDETPQALYARIKQLYLDNLLTTDGPIHTRGRVEEDEEMSPTLLNTLILHWLQVLHPDLRNLITQRFITQLRDHTFAAILPEISRSVESLLEELNSSTPVNRAYNATQNSRYPHTNYPSNSYKPFNKPSHPSYSYKPSFSPSKPPGKHCQFCKLTGKRMFYTHQIEDCLFIKRLNTQSATAKQVCPDDDLELQYEEYYEHIGREESACLVEHIINMINIDASPVLELQANSMTCMVTLDTGATCNLMKEEKARQINATIKPTSQKVRMADGTSALEVVGETEVTLYRNNKPYQLSAIVCRNTDTDILAGMPFMKTNDVAVRPFSDEIIIGGSEFIKYDPHRTYSRSIRRLTLQSDRTQVILPGESTSFKVSGVHGKVAVEPRWDTAHNKQSKESSFWPSAELVDIVNGVVTLQNCRKEPILLHKSEPVCNLHTPTFTKPEMPITASTNQCHVNKPEPSKPANTPKRTLYTNSVNLNPDNVLNNEEEAMFRKVLSTYDDVFGPVNNSTYNDQ